VGLYADVRTCQYQLLLCVELTDRLLTQYCALFNTHHSAFVIVEAVRTGVRTQMYLHLLTYLLTY